MAGCAVMPAKHPETSTCHNCGTVVPWLDALEFKSVTTGLEADFCRPSCFARWRPYHPDDLIAYSVWGRRIVTRESLEAKLRAMEPPPTPDDVKLQRAIRAVLHRLWPASAVTRIVSPGMWAEAEDIARAVIEAVKDPSPLAEDCCKCGGEMTKSQWSDVLPDCDYWYCTRCDAGYQARPKREA
jgi:hypothetical protein